MLHVVVLAAGQGKRMVSALPKVLHPLAGRPLLAHVLAAAGELAPAQTHVVVGHGGAAVRAAFPTGNPVWVEQTAQLGTGHAVMQALPGIDPSADVLVLYGDVPLVSAANLRRLVEASDSGLAIMTVDLEQPAGYGRIVRTSSGGIERIVEEKDANEAQKAIREVNVGFLCAKAARLSGWLSRVKNSNAQREYYLTDVVALAVAEGVEVAGVKVADPWEVAGVNSKRDLAAIERVWQRRQAENLLDAGVTLADSARIDIRGSLQCGRDVSIDVNCVFEGRVVLGEGVRIGPNCVLREVTIGAGTEVLAFSLLDSATVGTGCKIGPYARLRPGASLAEDVHIGNFVEVKASRIGRGSKANHLAYVGDAEVGSGVNIGAGTITCNYDGVAKHKTIIEDGSFIGSDATLVAPVRIARGSYIGAGSTISKDTAEGQLTVARARQVTIPGWKPKTRKA